MRNERDLCKYLKVTKQCFAGCICTAKKDVLDEPCGRCRWCFNENIVKMSDGYVSEGCFLENKTDKLKEKKDI